MTTLESREVEQSLASAGHVVSTRVSDSLISTLPGCSYVDEGVFTAEQSRLLESMWFCAVRTAMPGNWGMSNSIWKDRSANAVNGAVCRHPIPNPPLLPGGAKPRTCLPPRTALTCWKLPNRVMPKHVQF